MLCLVFLSLSRSPSLYPSLPGFRYPQLSTDKIRWIRDRVRAVGHRMGRVVAAN